MSVNVSAKQLSHPGFEAMVVQVLSDNRVDPGRITLEITESLFIDDIAGKANVLKRLRLLGIKVAIDDFGTGYSSLSTLRDIPVDTLKIDKSFIDDIANSLDAARLVQTIVHLANDMGLATVAEGVEALDQVEVLRGLGCQLMQGYYFSGPLPAPDLERLLGTGIEICESATSTR
jgi:EAL domain-containing protein (putative c-di-GMP-specific phosphodiesterase class I)